jgi:hypothetical protein
MSFYKPRIGRTNPSGHPIHTGPGDHDASASSADFPQPLDPSLSDATPAPARQADLVCLADIEPRRPIDWLCRETRSWPIPSSPKFLMGAGK